MAQSAVSEIKVNEQFVVRDSSAEEINAAFARMVIAFNAAMRRATAQRRRLEERITELES